MSKKVTTRGVASERIANAVREILLAIGEDPDREGLQGTPNRIAGMYQELFAGLREEPEDNWPEESLITEKIPPTNQLKILNRIIKAAITTTIAGTKLLK